MTRNAIKPILSTLCVLMALFLTGCEDNGGGDAPSVDVTGTWSFNDYEGWQGTGQLVQSGNTVTGTVGGGTASGTVSGRSIKMTLTYPERVVSVDGTVSADGLTMSGTWAGFDGPTGQWSGSRQ